MTASEDRFVTLVLRSHSTWLGNVEESRCYSAGDVLPNTLVLEQPTHLHHNETLDQSMDLEVWVHHLGLIHCKVHVIQSGRVLARQRPWRVSMSRFVPP